MIETIRALFTFITAFVISVGGLAAIVFVQMDPDTKTIVGAFVGAAITFLFGRETAQQSAKQSAAATIAANAATNGNGNGTHL